MIVFVLITVATYSVCVHVSGFSLLLFVCVCLSSFLRRLCARSYATPWRSEENDNICKYKLKPYHNIHFCMSPFHPTLYLSWPLLFLMVKGSALCAHTQTRCRWQFEKLLYFYSTGLSDYFGVNVKKVSAVAKLSYISLFLPEQQSGSAHRLHPGAKAEVGLRLHATERQSIAFIT